MVESINQDIVYGLAASPEFMRDRICFAARHSGLWRSDDGGTQWRLTGAIPGISAALPASAVAVSSNFQSDSTVFAGIPGGILRSTDGGNSWVAVALASPPPFVSALAISPNYETDGVVLAATLEDGIFRTQDRGTTWQAWNFGLFDLKILSITVSPGFAHDRTVYIGTETGVFYSTNSGRAWRETGFPNDFAPVQSLVVSPQFIQDGIVFAGTESFGLFYSNDKGQTWQRMLECVAINAILLSPTFPATADVLVVSNDFLWLSGDGGKSWSKKNTNENFNAGFTAAAVPARLAPESSLLLGLSDGKVLWFSL